MFSFNLVDEPWIPCLTEQSEKETIVSLSLTNTLNESMNIKAIIGDNPLVTIAIHRLLLAVIHKVVAGPRNSNEWGNIWQKGEFDKQQIKNYLLTWRQRFDLFHEQTPFYQTVEVPLDKAVSSARLLFQDDENATLFDHTLSCEPPEISPALSARLVLVCQAFDVSGLITGENKADTANAGPLNQSAVCLIRGRNLFETLMLNLHHYSHKDEEPFAFEEEHDLPAWENDEPVTVTTRLPKGYLDLLTWQSRRIRLVPERKADGEIVVKRWVKMKGEQFPKGFSLQGRETMVAFKKREKAKPDEPAWSPTGFIKQKVLWRDSHCLLQSFANQSMRPKTMTWIGDLATEGILKRSQILPIDFLGLSTDKAKRLFWRHENLPVSLEYIDRKELVDRLREATAKAEEVESALKSSIWSLAQNLILFISGRNSHKEDVNKLADSMDVVSFYWSQLETHFKHLLADLPNDQSHDEDGELVYGKQALADWARKLNLIANEAFQIATRSLDGSSRGLKAVAIAQGGFNQKLRTALSSYINNGADINTTPTGGAQ